MRLTFCCALLAVLCLSACSSKYSLLPRVINELQSQAGLTGGDAHIPKNPNPTFRYLRVDVDGKKPALMVLAFEETHKDGLVEVWYSSSGQVIKTNNGRVVFTSGLETNWAEVKFSTSLPDWQNISNQSIRYQRWRDQMPGYRFGLSEEIQLQPINGVPSTQLPSTLSQEKALEYRWYQEVSSSGSLPSWYAFGWHRGQNTIVYSEQCLSPVFCLKLQRWPVQEEAF